jgi:hypothetical protein
VATLITNVTFIDVVTAAVAVAAFALSIITFRFGG